MRREITGWLVGMLIGVSHTMMLPIANAAANEDDYICEARQQSKDELPVLDRSCPIGKGLWGRTPQQDVGLFWIQCGLLEAALPLEKASQIYNKMSTDVWMKPEDKGFRCLVGPYESFAKASKEMLTIRDLKPYKEAFIRMVNGSPLVAKASSTKKQPQSTKAAAIAKPKQKPTQKAVSQPVASASNEPLLSPQIAPAAAQEASTEQVVVRRETKVDGRYFMVPFLMSGQEQFYMEHNVAWNRVSADKADNICKSQGMQLLSQDDWKRLLSSQVISKKRWPLYLPYWGKDKTGLFTSGKVTKLTGTSLLNVVCVK